MYWAYGVPSIYTATNLANLRSHLPCFEDVSENAIENGGAESATFDDDTIIGVRASRSGHIFATITETKLIVWQSRPTAALASYSRSADSLKKYGQNKSLLIKPDASIIIIQTSDSYLITFSVSADADSRVYKQQFDESKHHHHSHHGVYEENGMMGISMRSGVIIKIDAGIEKVIPLDDELVVATTSPPAIQCIRWHPDRQGTQASAEVSIKLSRIPWIAKGVVIADMVHDKAMNLSIWITNDGKAYAVQRIPSYQEDSQTPKRLFRGYCFHDPQTNTQHAVNAAINARFSLLAVGCVDGSIKVYTAKDYVGSIPLSHSHVSPSPFSQSGPIHSISYSPDGNCLFAGFERGWMTWSTYGKPGSSSFSLDASQSEEIHELWLKGIKDSIWLANGSQLLLLANNDDKLWLLEMLRSSMTSCLTSGNLSRTMLQSSSGLMIYRGHDLSDQTTISGESSLWQHVQYPASYLNRQWPIRTTVISPDGRYIAVAGRRGLAHYSVNSGRWKVFDDPYLENSFAVRGGMCWHQYVLIAATESDQCYEVRLYSRDQDLDDAAATTHAELLPAPAVTIASSGEDSLLVYTYENILYHYVIASTTSGITLVQVGQIAFHGIIGAPARVRSVSWILPDNQLRDGDPSQDVSVASSLFLVDAKLVLLRPSRTETGALKYDMRVIAQNVEYFVLMRDQISFNFSSSDDHSLDNASAESEVNGFRYNHSLRDSLWVFDGQGFRMWTDIQDIFRFTPEQAPIEGCSPVSIPVDFYPLSIMLNKGIVLGIESELIQRRDFNFPLFRISIRSHLFLPHVLRHHLAQRDSAAALHLSHYYKQLSYFPHALEILLHDVLDEEVDRPASDKSTILPIIISFLSAFPQYLDIIVQCTRKTEVRSWRTLFQHLPPPQELFEQSLEQGRLKTAGGYLIVLHTFEEPGSSLHQLIRLLGKAKEAGDWDLCKELARFLLALDESGETLKEALASVGFDDASDGDGSIANGLSNGDRLGSDLTITGISSISSRSGSLRSYDSSTNGGGSTGLDDYVSSVD